MTENHKRKIMPISDMNNNEVIHPRKMKLIVETNKKPYSIGQIIELHVLNFMCHRNFSIRFYPTHMQIVTGENGSGKSTIANAISLCLGAQAKSTGRTSNVQSFIRKGETSAQITITLANEGPEAFKPALYGHEIQIIRRIGSRQSDYKILGANRRLISTRKETIDQIIQALSISPENPLCILHQEIAKHFLISSDSRKKYQFYMKVSQLDHIKQAYEQGICTIHLLTQRVDTMKEKHIGMLRKVESLKYEVKKINLRRNYEAKRRLLKAELISARANQTLQELLDVKYEVEQTLIAKDVIDAQILEDNNKIYEIDQKLANFLTEKNDFVTDIYGLNELLSYFFKQKQQMQSIVNTFNQQCENYRQILTDVELEQIYVQKQIDRYENLTQHLDDVNQQRLKFNEDILIRQEKQTQLDKIITSLTNDMLINDENMHEKQATIDFLKNEFKQKQQSLDELIKIDQDRENAYGPWIVDCLKSIENDQRFHRKPIGPIGHYIHCIDPQWAYAIEKHLASIMSSFICANREDEGVLLEIFASYSLDHRPPIYVRAYSDKVHDISGTLKHIKEANLLSIYDVLKINNVTVACALIDIKHIEATILIQNLEQVRKLRSSNLLYWERIDRKVKQVVEAWTCDGSNIKFDKTLRIYTNEKQPIKYFLTSTTQSLSKEELEADIKAFSKQMQQLNESMNELKANREGLVNEMNEANKTNVSNKNKLKELTQKLDHLNATMPIVIDCSLVDLQEKAKTYLATYIDTVSKYEQAKQKKDEYLQQLTDITENYENTVKKIDFKTHQYDVLVENLNTEQLHRREIKHHVKNLKKKLTRFNENICHYKNQIKQLAEQQSKKSQTSIIDTRSVHEIQNEIDAINNYLKVNEDTSETRRDIIAQYRAERYAAKQYKQTYERCYQQIECLTKFINKRQEGFLTIAEQHEYYLRVKFQNLMKNNHFDESDIHVDHKKEHLQLIVTKNQKDLGSLSGGERSISTFCFLLALWQSVYQPFRLLDEIDIYMDNERRNSSLETLYNNTLHHPSSQHIVFTPQTVDSNYWNALNVPVFNMPKPKRSNQEID